MYKKITEINLRQKNCLITIISKSYDPNTFLRFFLLLELVFFISLNKQNNFLIIL